MSLFTLSLTAQAKPNKQLIKAAEKEMELAAAYLGDYSIHPPVLTTAAADTAYITRGEEDIVIVEEALQFYKHGQVGQDVVFRAIKQLQRDLEDLPPAQIGEIAHDPSKA
jgi:hypothetical protein